MDYRCDICRYNTDDRRNYYKHLKTEKHKEKEIYTKTINDVYTSSPVCSSLLQTNTDSYNTLAELNVTCEYCKTTFSSRYNLKRHQDKRCEKFKEQKIQKAKDEKIKSLELELKYAEKANKEKTDYIMSGKAGSITNYNKLSIKSFIQQNYPDAPQLQSLNEDKFLLLGEEEQDVCIVEVLIYHHKQRLLANYLGDFIISHYKKENPAEQSMWTSDTSRLTYIIKELISQNKTSWNPDKRGIKTKGCIIEPFLDFLKTHMCIKKVINY
jgi:hypothetical protein